MLIRGRHDGAGLANGDFKEVAQVDPVANRVVFSDGCELPPDFAAWTYGHAITSYRSQGSTSEESILVLGEVAARALARRQFYVGSTRYRGAHAIYVADKEAILGRLTRPDAGRELATEFLQRHHISERLIPRALRNRSPRQQAAWLAAQNQQRQYQQRHGERRTV